MKIWLITVGEPLPLKGNERIFRTGLLANLLHEKGHEITWWTSSFDHVKKTQHNFINEKVLLKEKLSIFFLYGGGYKKNVSISRLLDHKKIANAFKKYASEEEIPDIILCSFPTIELSFEATFFGKANNIPVILDIRDLWPDLFLDLLPSGLQLFGRLILYSLFWKTKKAFKAATALSGVTDEFIDWGVKKSGRIRTQLDKSFPMGYPYASTDNTINYELNCFWEKQNINSTRFLVVFFGYFGRQFDLFPIFDAAKKLLDLPVDFVLCGTGDNYEKYNEKSKNLDNVFLPGWIDKDEIIALMKIAKIGLMPYVIKDNFLKNIPNKFIEYLSAQLPVLSSLRGITGDLLVENKCGFVYESSDDIVNIIKFLYENPDKLILMKEFSGQLFHDRFQADIVYSEMETYLINIINNFEKNIK